MSRRTIIIIAGSFVALALVIGIFATGAGRALAQGTHLRFFGPSTSDMHDPNGDNTEHGHGHGHGPNHLGVNPQPIIDAVAATLKISSATLTADITSGKTIAQIAQAQNVALTDVNAAFLKALKTQLAAAVTAGTITQAQSDAAYTRAQNDVTKADYSILHFGHMGGPDGKGGHGPMGGPGGFGHPPINPQTITDAVAASLKLTSTVLTTDLSSGQTLAQVAQAQNVAIADVNTAYVTAVKTQLAAAVTAGTITQAQSDTTLADVQSEVAQGEYHFLFGRHM